MIKTRGKQHEIDFVLAISVFVLAIFGLVMISSVSIYESYNLTYRMVQEGRLAEPSNAFYFWKHLIRLLIAISCGAISVFIPYKFWRKLTGVFFALVSIAVWSTLFVGTDLGTISKNWLDVPIVGVLQPSEFMKIAIIFYLSTWLSKSKRDIKSLENGFVPFLAISGIAILPIVLQPDYGTALIVLLIATIIFFIAGARISHLLLGIIIFILGTLLIFNISSHAKKRFETFFKKYSEEEIQQLDETTKQNVLNQNWQRDNSIIAVGSGEFFGKGFGRGIQKNGYLPEAQSDMIFAASAEELGFLRMLIVILIYFLILSRGTSIALSAPDLFSKLASIGIASGIIIQAIINVAMSIDLFPITGITLPMISYGGSSLILTCFELGILLNISSYTVERKKANRR